MWITLAACTSPYPSDVREGRADQGLGPSSPLTEPISRCRVDDATCLDAETLPVVWQAEPGLRLSAIEVADFNADGVDDVKVDLGSSDVGHTSIVFGPIGEVRALPADEDFGIDTSELGDSVWADEVTGDGVVDIVWNNRLYPGPLVDLDLDPARAVGELAIVERAREYDGKPGLEYALMKGNQIDLWTGTWDTWGIGEPTLTLSMPCTGGDLDPSGPVLELIPDLDHDGVNELWVSGNNWGCPFFLVPANTTGFVDVPSTYTPVDVKPPPSFGDQDADGFGDFRIDTAVLSGPLTWSGGKWSGAPIGTLVGEMANGLAMPISVVGDERPDVWSESPTAEIDEYTTLFSSGGPDGGWARGEVEWKVISNNGFGCFAQVGSSCAYLDGSGTVVRLVPLPQ